MLRSSEPPVSAREPIHAPSGSALRQSRIIVADSSAKVRRWLCTVLARLDADLIEAGQGSELEHKLQREGPFDLVVTHANLEVQSGLSVLARARARGDLTPFVVITSVHAQTLRVFVSDAEGTVLSSRVVDGDNLASLGSGLIARAAREE